MGLNSESEEETEELRPAALVILLADFFLVQIAFSSEKSRFWRFFYGKMDRLFE